MARSVQYVPDGARIRASADDVASTWQSYARRVPAEYAVGTAQHESDFTLNEIDTEASGFVSKGIFQVADSEADEVGQHGADLLDLNQACAVFAALAERNLNTIIAAGGLDESALPSDVWAYLVIAHNEGVGAVKKTIAQYGVDWAAYKARNAGTEQGKKIAAYGDDSITGGSSWTGAAPSSPSADDASSPSSSSSRGLIVAGVALLLAGAAWLAFGRPAHLEALS